METVKYIPLYGSWEFSESYANTYDGWQPLRTFRPGAMIWQFLPSGLLWERKDQEICGRYHYRYEFADRLLHINRAPGILAQPLDEIYLLDQIGPLEWQLYSHNDGIYPEDSSFKYKLLRTKNLPYTEDEK